MRSKLFRPADLPKIEQEFLTLKEAAKLLRISVSTIRRRIEAGELIAIGEAKILIHVADFYDYVERRRRKSKRLPRLGRLVHPATEGNQVIDISKARKTV